MAMNSAVVDFYELSCTAGSALNIRFSEREVAVRFPPAYQKNSGVVKVRRLTR
jgi:hypothetical protein